ncbi:hypothetical protein RIF29_12259 [Crotalaria pallida]|uniref:Uncharacterized protein n=1 Tax=Crotalaria pallida TaxID=3830 RepID=A0AAN9P106_CROPI
MARMKGKGKRRQGLSSSSDADSSDWDSKDSVRRSKRQKTLEEDKKKQVGEGSSSDTLTRLFIEHSTKAEEVKQALEERVPGITVIVKTRKLNILGSFDIRKEGGEKLFNLWRMKRPFQKLKDLNVAEVVADVTARIS